MQEVDPNSRDAAMEARIPTFDNELKVQYLKYRAVGFSFRESCHMAEVKASVVMEWRRKDKEFKAFEFERINDMQKYAAKELLELEFRRNALMFMRKDGRIINKSMNEYDNGTGGFTDGIENLTEREYDYLKAIRKHYTPDQMLQLSKALEPERHSDNTIVVLEWTGRPNDEALSEGDAEAQGFGFKVIENAPGD